VNVRTLLDGISTSVGGIGARRRTAPRSSFTVDVVNFPLKIKVSPAANVPKVHSQRRRNRLIFCGNGLFRQGSSFVNHRLIALLGGLFAGGMLGFIPVTVPAAPAAKETKPTISEEATAALMRMGQTLSAEQFSFQARTIRVYSEANGGPLHIFHTMKVTVHRPNKMLVDLTGDDGSAKLAFDGKTLTLFSERDKKYASMSVPKGPRSTEC
jgi:hypothetical protein